MNEQPFMEMLERVSPKIHRFAGYLASKSDHLTPGDCYQEAVLKMWERYLDEPDFLSHSDTYFTTFTAWAMKNLVNRERNMWSKRIACLETEDGEQYSHLTGHYPRPEREAVRSEVRSIAEKMPNQYKIIYNGTVQGYKLQEIADFLNIPKTTLKWRKRVMLGRLQKAWRTPIGARGNVIREMHELPSVKRASA